jgi:translation initiation factor 2 subunit 2
MSYEQMLEGAYKKVKRTESNERFEIPKVKGHHEGTKTILTNFLPIVLALRREPEHLAKFLNKELASSSEISGERLILSRKLSSKEINEKVERYANSFVLCPKCKKPDTELTEGKDDVTVRCLACGERRQVHKI